MKNSDFVSHLCLAVVLAFGPVAGAAERQAKFSVTDKQMQTLAIRVMPLQSQAAPVMLSLPAQVVVPPGREQVVSAPLAGLAVQLFVQQNQVVKRGAPLLRLVSPELGQLQLQLMQTATRATLARQAAQRERALFDEGIIPRRRVQETHAALQESEAALRQAKAALRLADMSTAAINRIAAGKLEDSLTLRAAQAGTVTSIDVKPGQRVEASTALLRLAQTDILWLDIQAPVADAANWQPGARLKIQGRDSAARIVSVGSSVSAGSQTVALRAVVETGAKGLRAGEFVSVELPSASTSEGWDIPLSAVAHDGNQAYVFVRSPDSFEARPVKVIASAGQRVRIQGALKAGENIAVSGVVALKGAWLDEKGGN
ncbi:MAG: efflux RND transporter periplasmic adaptor subunit [Sulfuriferula sp.]